MNRLLIYWFVFLLLFIHVDIEAAERVVNGRKPPCLQGTFIQLDGELASWKKKQWKSFFETMQQLKINSVIVQWSVLGNDAFYASSKFHAIQTTPLNLILELADSTGMRVTVGLSHDPSYWDAIKTTDKRSYLEKRLKTNRQVALELLPQVIHHTSFVGWYISDEVDSIDWSAATDQQLLFLYLQQLAQYLHDLTSKADIGISGFASPDTTPAALKRFWQDLLMQAVAVHTVYFQDGIGAANLKLSNLDKYFKAIKTATDATHRDFVPVIELFRQTAGEPLSQTEFAAVSTTLARLLKQIDIADRYAERHVVFALPNYMAAKGSSDATLLYNDFLRMMHSESSACLSF